MTKAVYGLLPIQEQYFLIRRGNKYATFGGSTRPGHYGLLVFANLERAEQFCMTVANRPGFKRSNKSVPVRVSADALHSEALRIGAVCVVEGLQITVARIAEDERSD